MKFPRTSYYPCDATVTSYDVGAKEEAEVARYTTRAGKPAAAMFGGKRTKPDSQFYYVTEESREEQVTAFLNGLKRSSEFKAEQSAAKKGGHTLKVGDVLSASWGYDQTNVDFYQVVGVPSKCFVMLKAICGKIAEGTESGGPSESVVAAIGSFKTGYWDDNGSHQEGEAPAMRRKASKDNCVKIDSCRFASFWDGRAMHKTGWGYGH